jgi:putative flippase GtrA
MAIFFELVGPLKSRRKIWLLPLIAVPIRRIINWYPTQISAQALWELAVFAIVGITGTGLYAAIVLLLARLGGLDLFMANHFAIAASALWSYFGHRLVTFKYGGAHAPAVSRFLVQLALLYVISNGLLFAVDRSGIDSLWGVAAIVTLNPFISYLALKFWAFRHDHRI